MPLLKAEPTSAVHSMSELFAVAHAMEEEAAQRYGEFAREMRERGMPALADLFERLAEMERSHVELVDRWSTRRSCHAPDPTAIRWEIPETFDADAIEELAASRLATPYRALTIAVQNEERAFAFWSYVAAQATDDGVRRAAETMAHEELEHVALLRRERRQAYHAERRAADFGEAGTSADDLLSGSVAVEARLAVDLDRVAAQGNSETHARAQALADEARQISAELAAVGERRFDEKVGGLAGSEAEDLARLAERLVERYLEAADRARDETTLARAQNCAKKAIVRLRQIRRLAADAQRRL